jgi:hypothetical protein
LSARDAENVDEFEWKEKFERLLKNLPLLEKVHLIGDWVDDDCLHSVAKLASKKLTSLKISNAGREFGDAGCLTDEGIVDFTDELLSKNAVLRSFDISQWHSESPHQVSMS